MNDIAFPRTATILKDTGIVSSIAQMQAPPSAFAQKGKSADSADFYHEVVSTDVRVGMVRSADGTFDWPICHPEESYLTRKACENILKAGRAA